MAFQLTKTQKMVQSLAKEFADKELAPIAAEMDKNERMEPAVLEKLAKMGFMGIGVPKEYGGAGFGMMEKSLMVTELAKQCASTAEVMAVHTMAITGIIKYGTPEQKEKYLTGSAKGWIAGFALTEPNAGSDAANVQTTAVLDGDEWVINGSKCFITNGSVSDYFVVFTTTDVAPGTKGMACFMVPKGTPGFEQGKRHNTMGIRSAAVCELYFNDCRVSEANMVAEPGKGFALAMKSLDGGRIGVAAQGLGIAEGAFEIARKYMMEREQFGKPIAKQQNLAFRMVDMQVQIEQAKYMLYKAALDKQEGRPYTESAAKAKLVCTDAAMHVTTEAVQMLGGNGFMKEYHVERMMRDAKITQIYEGSNEIQKLILSGKLFK